jgi:hypothetical protein
MLITYKQRKSSVYNYVYKHKLPGVKSENLVCAKELNRSPDDFPICLKPS